MMKALRLFGKNDIRMVNLPMPSPSYGETVVRVKRCGICSTDYAIFKGAFASEINYPLTLGHEWSGEVVEIGECVDTIKVGDRVAGDTCVSCGNCYECLIGNYNHCKSKRNVGTTNTWDGAYAEYILFPARHLFKLPDKVDYDSGALIEPVATAMLSVVKGNVGLGDSVLVHGTGMIGISAAVLSKIAGASKVAITGRKKYKLELAKKLGVDYAINTLEQDVIVTAKEVFSKEGANVVIEASGAESLMRDSIDIVAKGGRIAIVSFFDQSINFDFNKAVFKDVSILPVAGNKGMAKVTLELILSGKLNVSSLITNRCKLNQVPEILKHLKENNEKKIKTMIEY